MEWGGLVHIMLSLCGGRWHKSLEQRSGRALSSGNFAFCVDKINFQRLELSLELHGVLNGLCFPLHIRSNSFGMTFL